MAKKKQSKMRIRGNHYYKYVLLYNPETRTKKEIPIKLAHIDDYDLAMDRKEEVEIFVARLKMDKKLDRIVDYEFYWNSDSGRNQFKQPMKITDGIDKFIKSRNNARRKSTIEMNINSFNHWLKFFKGKVSLCKDIKTKHLRAYVTAMKGKRSDTSINMDLRTLRTMLYYQRDMGEVTIIRSQLQFKSALAECPINDKEPIYITEVEFNDIMQGDWCEIYNAKRDWYKEVFQLYWDLGIRLAEGFKGIIDGNYLFIPEDVAKNGQSRYVRVNAHQISTLQQMQSKFNDMNRSEYHIEGYSKMFKKAIRECGIDDVKHFHCLRHSYALRRRIETNGNYQQVASELGHKDVNVTLKYQRCDERKLLDDFPSYKEILEALQSREMVIHSTMNTSTMKDSKTIHPPRQMD